MICGVCDSLPSKYKCPACRKPYCSLQCWKTHKEAECKASQQKRPEPQNNPVQVNISYKATYDYPTEDTVEPEKLRLLGENRKIRDILSNPHLRSKLAEIDAAKDPGYAIKSAMLEPIFAEFADECMHILEPWSKEELKEERLLN